MRRECRECFPHHRLQRKPLVSDPGMLHGTCVTHVPWCMTGSLTRGSGENVLAFPAHAQPEILRNWQEAHCISIKVACNLLSLPYLQRRLNQTSVEFGTRISNHIPYETVNLITYPCADTSLLAWVKSGTSYYLMTSRDGSNFHWITQYRSMFKGGWLYWITI